MIGASKSFGAFRALDAVSLKIAPGSVHALLGENGAGKSTLVKGLVGYGPLDAGQIIAGAREVRIASPRDAQALDIGMVYQHFTLAAGMSVEENLLLARRARPPGALPVAHAVPAAPGRTGVEPRGRRKAEARDPQAATWSGAS